MKQTAVEWLENEIFRRYKFTLQQLNCGPLEEAIQQSKEMEKQQIIEFAEWCLSELLDGNEPKAETMQGLLEIFKNK